MENKKQKTIDENIVSGCAILMTAGLFGSCMLNSEYVEARREYNSMINDVKSSSQFQEYKIAHEKALMESYRIGEITAEEFSQKLAVLSSVDFIYDNREFVMPENQSNELEQNKNKFEETGKALVFTTAATVSSGVSALMTYLISEKIRKQNKPTKFKEIPIDAECNCEECSDGYIKPKAVRIDQSEFEF